MTPRWRPPTRAVDDPGPGRPGQRSQTSLGRHQLLRFDGQLPEIGLQGPSVLRREWGLAPGHPGGDLRGGFPGDQLSHAHASA